MSLLAIIELIQIIVGAAAQVLGIMQKQTGTTPTAAHTAAITHTVKTALPLAANESGQPLLTSDQQEYVAAHPEVVETAVQLAIAAGPSITNTGAVNG